MSMVVLSFTLSMLASLARKLNQCNRAASRIFYIHVSVRMFDIGFFYRYLIYRYNLTINFQYRYKPTPLYVRSPLTKTTLSPIMHT